MAKKESTKNVEELLKKEEMKEIQKPNPTRTIQDQVLFNQKNIVENRNYILELESNFKLLKESNQELVNISREALDINNKTIKELEATVKDLKTILKTSLCPHNWVLYSPTGQTNLRQCTICEIIDYI